MKRVIKGIVACGKRGGIGIKGQLPWNYDEDLQYFGKLTSLCPANKKNALIIGSTTYKHLPVMNRSSRQFFINHRYTDADELIMMLNDDNSIHDIWICGGAKTYEKFMKYIDELYITEIDRVYPLCDAFFPEWQRHKYRLAYKIPGNDGPYNFCLYKKIHEEQQYLDIIGNILMRGTKRHGTRAIIGCQTRWSLEGGVLPILTTKNVFFRGVVEELLWILRGEVDAKSLSEKGIHIWDSNGERAYLDAKGLSDYPEGYLGPIYGKQMRSFGVHEVDQLSEAIRMIRERPQSRRIIINMWNASELNKMALPPCHILYQFHVEEDKLSLSMTQRSADMMLGVPFNICSASLLCHIIANVTGLKAYEFIHTTNDTHIYDEHIDGAIEQVKRTPYPFPKLQINKTLNNVEDIEALTYEDFKLINYKHHSKIKYPLIV